MGDAARCGDSGVQGCAGHALSDGDQQRAKGSARHSLAAPAPDDDRLHRHRVAYGQGTSGRSSGMRGGDVVRSPLDKCLACCLTIALLALPATARAQIAGAQYCSNDVFNDGPPIEGANPIERMHPLLGRARHAEQVRNEQWTEALRGLKSDAMQAFVAAGVAPAHQLTFLAQLDSVLDVLPRLPAAGAGDARARFVADSVRSIRFQPVQGVSSYQLFRRAERIDIAGLDADQAKALCWSALS